MNTELPKSTDKRCHIYLAVPGFRAEWLDSPERIEKLIALARECIVESSLETTETPQREGRFP